MSPILARKLLRDVRTGLIAVCVLLAVFELLWCKATEQAVFFVRNLETQIPLVSVQDLTAVAYREESGKMMQKMIGGNDVNLGQGFDYLTIGYVHPLLLTILCVWAIGRAAGAVAGELDKGTLELLLAQPIERWRVIATHFVVDVLTIPVVCLCMWGGTVLGTLVFDLVHLTAQETKVVNAWRFGLALPNIAALLFAVSGGTMLLSSAGRSRTRVLGIAVVLALVQFLVNLLGQIWTTIAGLRPFTVFYYYQPQALVLGTADAEVRALTNVTVLVGVGLVGYALALVVFCRRDLPAPL
jgi:ABC-2 type transport system permease protein